MSKFDTHGGYFAPQGYMRVNAGGSHEENPNGGVQVGVDPEGTPNVLEENETVYDDYVYSDNIIAEKQFLEENNLPLKYAGKLYSEIADLFVDEAAEMPLDPIANNGLNAMLLRLANSQEEQKAYEQQQELEKELTQMTPEELAELEAALAEQEQMEAQPVEEPMPMEQQQFMQEMPTNETLLLQQPGMKRGGKMRKLAGSGPLDSLSLKELAKRASAIQSAELELAKTRNAYDKATEREAWRKFFVAINPFDPDRELQKAKMRLDSYNTGIRTLIEDEPDILDNVGFINNMQNNSQKLQKSIESAESRVAKKRDKDARIRDARFAAGQEYEKAKAAVSELKGENAVMPELSTEPLHTTISVESPTDTVTSVLPSAVTASSAVNSGIDTSGMDDEHKRMYEAMMERRAKRQANNKAFGGKINRFDWGSFLNQLGRYDVSKNRGNIRGTYRIDPNFHKRYGFNTIEDLQNSDAYKNFTRYVMANPTDPNVQKYLRALDAGTPQDYDVPRLFNGDKLADNWADTYYKLRNDGRGGIYHFMGDDMIDVASLYAPGRGTAGATLAPVNNPYVSGLGTKESPGKPSQSTPKTETLGKPTYTYTGTPASVESDTPEALPTWPRYAKALTAAGMGLYNAFQDPYDWNIPHVNPVLPYGRMHLVDPVYNLLDQNQVTNDLLANSAGTARGLMYSTPYSSVPMTLLAQDYNTGRNMGNAATTVWDANNQRRNAVITAHNQNAGTLGNFHYGQNRDRAQILNDFAWRTHQDDWMKQRLRYTDEEARAQAVGNQMQAVSDALMYMGNENLSRNMLASNPIFNYGYGDDGIIYYKGMPYWYGNCGGKMKK